MRGISLTSVFTHCLVPLIRLLKVREFYTPAFYSAPDEAAYA